MRKLYARQRTGSGNKVGDALQAGNMGIAPDAGATGGAPATRFDSAGLHDHQRGAAQRKTAQVHQVKIIAKSVL